MPSSHLAVRFRDILDNIQLIGSYAKGIRYDNETVKGDHRHIEDREERYHFTDLATLVLDFRKAVTEYLA